MSYTIKQTNEIKLETEFAGKTLVISTGIMAPQADGAIRLRYANTEILVTAVMNRNPNPDKDFLPLTIDFRDFNPAVGKIWWWPYRKREWRPSETMILYSRIVDRTLRPMFPKWLINDIVITITPLAFDRIEDMAILGILWWSLAIMAAGIPFDGPVSWVRVWFDNSQNMILSPNISDFELNWLNLLVSGKKWTLNMIEMDGLEISEETIQKAFELSQKWIDQLCDIQVQFLQKLN